MDKTLNPSSSCRQLGVDPCFLTLYILCQHYQLVIAIIITIIRKVSTHTCLLSDRHCCKSLPVLFTSFNLHDILFSHLAYEETKTQNLSKLPQLTNPATEQGSTQTQAV